MRNIEDRQLKYQQRNTEDIIRVAGTYIALQRPPDAVPDGAGAVRTPDVPPTQLPAVKRYLVGLMMVGRGVNQQPERWIVTSLGKRYKLIRVMIGLPEDDIQAGDYFFDSEGQRNEVVFVHEDRRFQTKAEVIVVA